MGKLIGKVNNKNDSSSGKVVGHIAPQAMEKLLYKEQEEAMQEAKQNAVKTASRYQAMTLHERKLQEQEQENISKKLYGESFTPKNFKGRVQKYFDGNNITYEEVKDDKKYFDSYAQLISNTDPANRSKQDEILLKLLSDLSVSAQDIINKTDNAKEEMDSSWKSVKVADGIELSWPERLAQYVMFGDSSVFEDAAADERDDYAAAANEYYGLAVGDVEARKQRITELEARKSELRRGESDIRRSQDIKKEIKSIDEEIRNIKASINGYTNAGEYISSQVGYGVSSLITSLAATGEVIFYNPIKAVIDLCGGDSSFLNGKPTRDALNSVFEERALKSSAALGDKYNIGGTIIHTLIQQIPNVFMAGLGWYDDVINGASRIISNGNKIGSYLKSLAKNPMFWTSFAQTMGNEYEQAVATGENPTIAMTYALLSSSINAAIEIGGGIETLPRELRNIGTDEKKLLKWVISSFEEGGEEILQNTVGKTLGYIAFDRSTITREELNDFSKDTLNQGALGAIGGFIIGGGQVTFENIVNAKSNQEYSNIGRSVIDTDYFGDIIKYAKNSDNLSIRNYANNINPNDINAYQAGVIYSYVCKDINTMISAATNIESLNVAYETAVKTAGVDNSIIIGIITPRYIEKAASLGVDSAAIIEGILNTNKKTSSDNHSSTDENSNTTESSNLQDSGSNDIINTNGTNLNEGENNANQRTTEASVEEIRERFFKKTPDSIGGSLAETAESFAERTSRDSSAGSGRARILLKDGNSQVSYVESAKNTSLTPFIEKLRSIGIDAFLCEGIIETNANNITSAHHEAFTTASGKIFFSDSATLADKELVDHELVHNMLRKLDDNYFEYEDVLIQNLNRESNYYIAFCLELNEREFNNKYDIAEGEISISGAAAFNAEIAAYVYQHVLNDPAFANEFFSNMFFNWGEVTTAVHSLNSKMKIDTNELTQATSDTEVASFVPENEQGEVFESGEENNAPETQNPVSEEFEEDFEEESGSFFDEPSAEFPKPNLIEDIGAKAAGVTRYSEGQRLIIRIGKNLGYKVIFDPELKTKLGATSNGKIDFDNKIIYLNPAISKPLQFIFVHEITHFSATSETFEEFIDPIRETNLYLKWLQRKTGSASSSVGLLEGLYRERVMESRKNADPMGAAEAQEEMYADFCGETFFSDGERGLTRLLNSLEGKKRSKVMQFILDFVSYLKEKLSGNKDITLQLIRLESKFADLLKSAKENTAHNSGVKYSVSEQSVIDLSDDSELSKQIGNLRGAPKYKIIQNYILKVLENQPIILSDGKSAIVDRSDALHIANKSGNEKAAQISKIKELVESAKLYAEDTEVEHNKFNYFCYYKADVKFGNETFPIFLNVGRGINDNKYHIYDITKKIRDTAHRINGVERPKPNEGYALENGISSNITVPQKAQSVNIYDMPRKEKYSISLDETAENDTETDTDTDIGDIPSAMEELMQQYQNGDFGEDIFRARMDEIYNEALNRFGVIPEGENAETPISVPQKITDDKITRRFVRTILETGKLTSDMIADVEGEILLGDMMSYEEVSNETAMKRADRSFERGTAEADWQKVISGGVISETDIAIGEKLLLKAIEDNDRLKVLDLSSELSDIFTRSGRVVQAARMLKKMSGVGRLMTAQRNVTAINQSLTEKYGDRKDVPQVKLNPTLARQLAETQSFEDTEVVYQNVLQDIAAQVPATFMDKLNAWRYFAMLANPRTHIRNLVSNTIFTPSVMIKNLLATGAEHLFVRDKSKRTKAVFIKKEYLEFAKKDIKSREAKVMLEGKGQLDDKGMIQELRRTFDSDFLENLTKGNSNLLEKEDMWFKSVHYRNALAGFLQARKVNLNNISEATLLQAREYAVKEAKKATFQDASVLADLLNNIKTPKNYRGDTAAEAAVTGARILVEGVLPFKRTPINIVKRGIEYSPLGLAETLTVGLFNVRKGKISVSEFCDGLAAGLTGSALMAIGYFLAAAGFAVGGFGDDDEDKFRQLNGEQEYSVQIFGKSYTVDWAAPAAIPFFIGVELVDEIKNGDGLQWRDLGEIAWNTLEPITNLSMLSGLQGLIETVKYVDSSRIFGAMVGAIGISFGMQLVPSFFGGISRTIDNTQRTWYNDKNSPLGSTAQTIKNNIQAKIPGLSFTQAPSIDAWGREKKRGSVGERIAENFISPGYYSKIDYDNADAELMRLAKATGEGVFPKQAEKSFSIGGETKYLTADEWVTFAKAKGEYSFDYIHEFIESDSYKKLTDEQRVKVIDNLYEYAKAKAKTTVSEYDLMKGYKSVTNFERNGGSAVTYYIRRAILN